MSLRPSLLALTLLIAGPALAGDAGDCRRARRKATVDAWMNYVLEHPGGRCEDEALGQLMVMAIGRVAAGMVGDPAKLALSMAQLARTSPDDLQALTSLFGGLGGMSGLGGLSGLGGGEGGLGGLGLFGEGSPDGYSDLFGTSGGVEGGLLGAIEGYEPGIYVSYYVDEVKGGWNEQAFWSALDATRPALQDCWTALGRTYGANYYTVGFDLADGKLSVTSLEQTYAADGADAPDVAECVRASLQTASFPVEYAGSYRYRVELY